MHCRGFQQNLHLANRLGFFSGVSSRNFLLEILSWKASAIASKLFYGFLLWFCLGNLLEDPLGIPTEVYSGIQISDLENYPGTPETFLGGSTGWFPEEIPDGFPEGNREAYLKNTTNTTGTFPKAIIG